MKLHGVFKGCSYAKEILALSLPIEVESLKQEIKYHVGKNTEDKKLIMQFNKILKRLGHASNSNFVES